MLGRLIGHSGPERKAKLFQPAIDLQPVAEQRRGDAPTGTRPHLASGAWASCRLPSPNEYFTVTPNILGALKKVEWERLLLFPRITKANVSSSDSVMG